MVERDVAPAGKPRKLALGRRRELSGGHYEPPARSWLTERVMSPTEKRSPATDKTPRRSAERRCSRSSESTITDYRCVAWRSASPSFRERERREGVPGADQT